LYLRDGKITQVHSSEIVRLSPQKRGERKVANKMTVGQLKKEMEKPINDPRMALIQQKMGQMYNPQITESRETRWDYATLIYPRTYTEEGGYGPSPEEGEELKSIGMDGWDMVSFQVYTIPGEIGQQRYAEYVFKRMIL
jgi:hypothetical protein